MHVITANSGWSQATETQLGSAKLLNNIKKHLFTLFDLESTERLESALIFVKSWH